MRTDWNDRPTVDPILDILHDSLSKVALNIEQRNHIRKMRGDEPLMGAPFITVSVATEHRSYSNVRVFYVDRLSTILDFHDEHVNDPKTEQVNPVTLRASAIISATVHTNVETLPMEFPLNKADLDAAVDAFVAEAERILSTGTTNRKDDVSSAQQSALVEAAKPVNEFVFDSAIGSTWSRYTQAISARHGRSKVVEMPATDKRLHRMVVIEEYGTRRGVPLSKFLTHGVPLEFLYTETAQVALDAYASYVESLTRREKRDNA